MRALGIILGAFLVAGPVWGQDFPSDALSREPSTDDTITLKASSQGHVAELYYRNHESMGSNSGVFSRSYEGVTVTVQIEILSEGPERITVWLEDPALVLVPSDPQEVMDGDDFTYQVMLPMF